MFVFISFEFLLFISIRFTFFDSLSESELLLLVISSSFIYSLYAFKKISICLSVKLLFSFNSFLVLLLFSFSISDEWEILKFSDISSKASFR